MLNYPAIIEILKSEHYDDKTRFFEYFCRHEFNGLKNTNGTGSSLFLKTFACFLDKKADAKEVFRHLDISTSEYFESEAATYQVLYFDFSDFKAVTFQDALKSINRIVADGYKDFFEECKENGRLEHLVDIIGLSASEQTLSDSLRIIMGVLRRYEWRDENRKLAVLFDNLINVELEADKNGYRDEMGRFLEDFITPEVYKRCDLFLQIGDYAGEQDMYWRNGRYETGICYREFNAELHDCQEDFKDFAVSDEKKYVFEYQPVIDNVDWDSFVANGRKKIEEDRLAAKKAHLEYVRKQREKYAVELSADVPKFSPNLGIRHRSFDKSNNRYVVLTQDLQALYKKTAPNFNANDIYKYMLGVLPDRRVVFGERHIKALENITSGNPYWDAAEVNTSWSAWLQVTVYRSGDDFRCPPAICENIKVYVAMRTTEIQDYFIDSLKYLAAHCKENFAAKAATCERDDQMCYWISASDFIWLRKFYKRYRKKMRQSLMFVSYFEDFGISREFSGMDDSHNDAQAHIISDYFKTIGDVSDVDLQDMYNNYIQKWNADIYEEQEYGRFRDQSALSFIVINDTLDALLGISKLSEDSLLLSGDPKIWRVLSKSYCWKDVNEKYLGGGKEAVE